MGEKISKPSACFSRPHFHKLYNLQLCFILYKTHFPLLPSLLGKTKLANLGVISRKILFHFYYREPVMSRLLFVFIAVLSIAACGQSGALREPGDGDEFRHPTPPVDLPTPIFIPPKSTLP